ERLTLLDVRTRAFRAALLVVPEREADRALGADVGIAEHPRQFHDQRRPRPVVVGGLAPADAVHVRADDVHLLGVGRPDLRAEDVLTLARPRRRRFGIELAQRRIGLGLRTVVHGPARLDAADPAATLPLRRIG